jgi:putative endonuclease
MIMPRATLYIIQSKEGYVYVGSTTDIEKRLRQHNEHKAGWTKRGTEWKIIYQEDCASIAEGRMRERWFKSGIGREKIKQILTPSS